MRNINALRHRKRPARAIDSKNRCFAPLPLRATDSKNRCSQLFPPFASTTNLAHHTKAHSTLLARETGTPELSIDSSPYGEPLARSPEMERVDFNFDGKADLSDNLAFFAMYGAGDPRADLDGDDNSSTHGEAGDGDWDIHDILAFTGIWGTAKGDVAVGVGRSKKDDNFFGLAGYRYDPLAAGGAARLGGGYHQRHRWMSPVLGRWGQRDPMGFVDGGSVYEYAKSDPVTRSDSHGLFTMEAVGGSRSHPRLTPRTRPRRVKPPATVTPEDSGCVSLWNRCKSDPFVRRALDLIEQECPRGREVELMCTSLVHPGGAAGTYNCLSNTIVIWSGGHGDCRALAHEMIHAADDCTDGYCFIDPFGWNHADTCKKVLCSEGRANTMVDCCHDYPRLHNSWEDCVTSRYDLYKNRYSVCHGVSVQQQRVWWDDCALKSPLECNNPYCPVR